MWEKIFIPKDYLWLGMRENVYLVALFVLLGVLATYAFQSLAWPAIRMRRFVAVPTRMVLLSFAVFMTIVFLRPIKQFIYFQF